MTNYYGSSYSDSLNSYNWNYNWNVFYMNDGNDTVIAPNTSTQYWFYGGNGNDTFRGGSANDTALGGEHNDNMAGSGGNDYLRGENGNDWLWGDRGYDTLIGDAGSDYLSGGTEQDKLWGGTTSGYDTFKVVNGDSNAYVGQHDIIYDWNPIYDQIDSSLAGTSTNYAEAATSATSITYARSQVQNSSSLRAEDHVFLYNSQTKTGYLLSDLDSNYSFETGVELKGASTAAWMNWNDIV